MRLLGVPVNVGCPRCECQSPRLHLFTFNAISLVLLVKCLEHVNIQSERFSAPCTLLLQAVPFFFLSLRCTLRLLLRASSYFSWVFLHSYSHLTVVFMHFLTYVHVIERVSLVSLCAFYDILLSAVEIGCKTIPLFFLVCFFPLQKLGMQQWVAWFCVEMELLGI